MEDKINVDKVLLGKPKGKRRLGETWSFTWEDIIKIILGLKKLVVY
jgi:hypothetical protein